MVNIDILNALSNKIYDIFGKEYLIYTETIKQGFEDKTFYISIIDSTNTSLLNDDFLGEYTVEILYFPTSDALNQRNECFDINSKLLHNLTSLRLNDCFIETNSINSRIVDDVLVITCNYKYVGTVVEETEYDYIEDLNIDMKGSV